jgi:cephalosporin hydroxylase
MTFTLQKVIHKFQRRYPHLASVLYATRKWAYPIRCFLFRLSGRTRYPWRLYGPTLAAAVGESDRRSDIRDHFGRLFCCAIEAKPRLIVELGTRGGGSTRALLAAAHLTGAARMLSVDIDDCGTLDLPFMDHWHFVKADDIAFGLSGFANWCRDAGLAPEIDLLFIDTSHEYEHTRREIEIWSPLLSAAGTMIFHDTNMGKGIYARTDGSVSVGWNNHRGVIRALEEHLGRQYDEASYFCDLAHGYLVTHYPTCSGLTVLRKCGLTDDG